MEPQANPSQAEQAADATYSPQGDRGYTLACRRCGAEVHGNDHDDEPPTSCRACAPYRLADYARPQVWLNRLPPSERDGTLDRRINARAQDSLAFFASVSVRLWRRWTNKEYLLADRRRMAAEGRI